jgi:outer membrane lipase/esterase
MKAKLSRTVLAAALALAAMPLYAQDQPTFTQTVFFGDSLTDGGYFRPLLPLSVQAVTGQFTTNPGQVWAQYLADYYGSNADSAWYGTGAGTRPGAGNNWAVGGARVGQTTVGALGYTPSLAAQVTDYLSRNGGHADPGALYTVWGGANDLFAVQADPAHAQAIIGGAVTAQVGIVGTLTSAGAKYILVPTIPDLGLTPSARAGGALAMAQSTALANTYNTTLFGALASSNMRVIPLDTFHFLQEIINDPSTYGIVNVTGTACQPQITAQSLTCNPTSLVSPNAPYDYAFADGVHPTTGSHKLLSQFAVSVIEGPRQIAILPHSEATIGRARTEMLATGLGNRPAKDGMRWWASFVDTNQRFGHNGTADGFDGDAPSLNGGMQWAAGNLTYGGFAAYGKADMDWGMRRGKFKQTDTTLGGFVGWYGDGPWANAQLSYTWLDYNIQRDIVLGPAVRTHRGSTNGSNLTGAASAGWTFGHGMLSQGPVLSLVSQRIDVDGFAESDPTLSTSLAYANQSFDSLVASVGWQASLALGEHITPYAKLTWDRELEKPAAAGFATAQSMPGTLPFAVPGLALDREYGTAQFGVRTEMFGMDVQTGTRITVNQDNGNNASFFLTVASKF